MRIIDESEIEEKEYLTRWLFGPWNSQSQNLDFGIAFFQPNQSVKRHFHKLVEEIFYVIEGEIVLLTENEEFFVLRQGMAAYIPPKQVHALQNRSNSVTKFIVVKSPSLPNDKQFVEE